MRNIIFLFLGLLINGQSVFAQRPITHTLPKPLGTSVSGQNAPKTNYLAKAKEYHKAGKYEEASKMLSNMGNWNSEAYELAGNICYLWNATLWYTYYNKAVDLGSLSAKQKLQRNVRLHVISVNGRRIDYAYSNDKVTNSNIKGIADVESLKREAESGNIDAQFNLGRMYEYGDWVEQDYAQAACWYDKSKDNRHLYSTINLAWLYSEGLGVEKDEQKAFSLYLIAAKENNDDAVHNIGLCYEYGKEVAQNKKEAIRWFRKNLDKKYDPFGQTQSAAEYYDLVYNQHIQDDQEMTENTCFWLYKYLHQSNGNHDSEIDQIIKKAESIGVQSAEIQSEYGRYFVYFKNKKNYEEGLKWLTSAADQNNSRAVRDIGFCYENGYGVPRDYAKAKEYYLQAKALGYNADNDLKRIEKKGF